MDRLSVLVTGSTGFIGSHLCRELCARGYRVRAFHRASSSLRLLEGLDVEHFQGDLTRPETIQAAVEGMDIVFHAAAWMGGQAAAGQQYAVTVEGTRSILQAARRVGVRRFVYTSSAAALGVPDLGARGGQPPDLIDEHHTWNYVPQYYPYGYAKYLAEMEVQQAVGLGLDAVIVNPTVIFGAGDIYRQADSTVTQVAERRLTFATEGGINCVHIDDVVDGHLGAMAAGKTGERYILGGENLSYLQLLQMIAGATGVPAPRLVVPAGLVRTLAGPAQLLRSFLNLPVPAELLRLAGRYFFYDRRKAAVELGLSNIRPVESAFREAYEWFTQGQTRSPANKKE
jgi:dihydroflavonol-4-reductase